MANMASKTIPGKRSSPPRTTRRALERYSRFIVTFKCIFAFVCMPVSNTRKMNDRLLMPFRNGILNALRVKEWRHNIIRMCKDAATEEDTNLGCKRSRDFTSAMHEKESSHNLDLKPEYWIQRCPFIFLDLGTGVGNKVAKFIDSGLEGCRRNDTDTLGFDPMHFDVGTGNFKEVVSNSMVSDDDFTHWVKGKIASFYPGLGPEDYCVYGVEPNPLVNADLFKLERHVNRMDPRPLRHLHFLTKKALHSEDDTKKTIYIDSVKNDQHFPGSSLFENHESVRESVSKFKDTFKYSVETIS